MKHRIAFVFAILTGIWMAAAFAQTPSSKTSLYTQITGCFPDNVSGLITPAITRQCLNNIVASFQQYTGVNPQVGTTYTIQSSDYGQLIQFTSSSPVAVTVSAASSVYPFAFYAKAVSSTVTITPLSGLINGASSYQLNANNTGFFVSDNTNWQVITPAAGTVTSISTGNGITGGPCTTTCTLTASYATRSVTGGYTVSQSGNNDNQTTVVAGGGAFYPITVSSTASFTAPYAFAVKNNDSAAGKQLVVNGLGTRILWPGQTIAYAIVGGSWVVTDEPGSWDPLGVSPTFYVNAMNAPSTCGVTGALTCAVGNNNNSCLTVNDPCQDPNQALKYIYQQMIFNAVTPTVNLAHGASIGYATNCTFGWSQGASTINIIGDHNAPTAVQVQAPGNGTPSVAMKDGCSLTLWAFEVDDSNNRNGGGLSCGQSSIMDVRGITFGKFPNTPYVLSTLDGCVMNIIWDSTASPPVSNQFADTFQNGILVQDAGNMQISIPFSISTPVAWTGTLFTALGGVAAGLNGSFTGAGVAGSTGTKCSIDAWSALHLGGIDPNTIFPGTPGTCAYTGTFPSDQVAGTLSTSSAGVGIIGQIIDQQVAVGTIISLTSAIANNFTSMSITAGDWEVAASAYFLCNTSTTVNWLQSSISTVSGAVVQAPPLAFNQQVYGGTTPFPSGTNVATTKMGPIEVHVSTPTTYYLVSSASFGTSWCAGYGAELRAQRRH